MGAVIKGHGDLGTRDMALVIGGFSWGQGRWSGDWGWGWRGYHQRSCGNGREACDSGLARDRWARGKLSLGSQGRRCEEDNGNRESQCRE